MGTMTSPALPIARNTALVSAALATHSAVLALAAVSRRRRS
jgi:hypothetical protein